MASDHEASTEVDMVPRRTERSVVGHEEYSVAAPHPLLVPGHLDGSTELSQPCPLRNARGVALDRDHPLKESHPQG